MNTRREFFRLILVAVLGQRCSTKLGLITWKSRMSTSSAPVLGQTMYYRKSSFDKMVGRHYNVLIYSDLIAMENNRKIEWFRGKNAS